MSWQKAEALFEKGLEAGLDTEEEAVWYRRALMVCPNHFDSLTNLGVFHSHREEHQMAALYFNRATIVDPYNPLGWFNLGTTMQILEDHERARKCYAECLKLDNTHKEAIHNLNNIGDK